MNKITRAEKEAAIAAAGMHLGDGRAWYTKWFQLGYRASKRGIVFELTFPQYLVLLAAHNITDPDQLGLAKHQMILQLANKADGYVEGNCRFVTSNVIHQQRWNKIDGQ